MSAACRPFVRVAACSVFSVLLFSCSGSEKLSVTEKARRITEKRAEAKNAYDAYVNSDYTDLESLQACADAYVESTKIAPGSCNLCFYHAGRALRAVGNHYRTLIAQLDEERRRGGDASAIEKTVESYRELVRENYRESNRMYQSYFRREGTYAHPDAHLDSVDNFAQLGEYDRALYHLGVFEEIIDERSQLGETNRTEIARLRRTLETRRRVAEDRRIEEELSETDRDHRPRFSN